MAKAKTSKANAAGTKIAAGKPLKPKGVEHTGYFFVAPFVIVFLIFSVYPVVRTFYLSLCEYKGGILQQPEFTGIDNYIRVFQSDYFWRDLVNTAQIWGINIVLQLGLAFLLTIVFSDVKYKIRGLGIYRAVYYLPNLIAATSIALLFKTLLDQRTGSLNILLYSLGKRGEPINWLDDTGMLTVTVIAVIQAWMWFGNSFIMLMAGVMGIPRDYFEAAAIDGAGRWKTFTSITLPCLKPILLYVGVTSLIGGLQMFDLPQLMIAQQANARDHVETVVMMIYKFGFGVNTKDIGYASAIAYVLFFIILIFSVIQFTMSRNKED